MAQPIANAEVIMNVQVEVNVPLDVRANVEVSNGITIGRAVGRIGGRIVACAPPLLLSSAKGNQLGITIKRALRNRVPE